MQLLPFGDREQHHAGDEPLQRGNVLATSLSLAESDLGKQVQMRGGIKLYGRTAEAISVVEEYLTLSCLAMVLDGTVKGS